MIETNERRPGGGGIRERGGSRTIIADPPRVREPATPTHVPTLTELSLRGQEIVLAYCAEARAEGIAEGRLQVEAELAARQRAAVVSVRAAANAGPYASLCELRGEPERAEHQRRLLAERGIWPVPARGMAR